MKSILAIYLLLLVTLGGCASLPKEANHGYTEMVKLECTRTLNVQTNENGVQIKFWDTKCRETSKELLPQP